MRYIYQVYTPEGIVEIDVSGATVDERNNLAIDTARQLYPGGVVALNGRIKPVKSPAEIKREGRMPTMDEVREFYDTVATPREGDGWFGSNQHIDESFGRTQYALQHIQPGMSVLEAGCADGGLSQHLVKAVGPEGFTTLVDISAVFVERAKAFIASRCPGAEVEFVVGDAAEYKTKRRYDVIVAMEILEHVPDPRKLLSNLFGLLRKDSGKIIISVPIDIPDQLGEHLHEFSEKDIAVIIGDATSLHVSTEVQGNTVFAVIDKSKRAIPYVR